MALTLSPAQLSTLEADRLKLIVVPLEVQPLDGFGDPEIIGDWVMFSFGNKAEAIRLSHTIGQTIPTPYGNLIVTGYADPPVKQVQDVTSDEARLLGRGSSTAFASGWNPFRLTYPDATGRHWDTPRMAFQSDFTTQHGPDAFDRNLWCAFVSVRKEQNDD